MRTRWPIPVAIAAALLFLAIPRPAEVAPVAASPALADTTSAEMPPIEVVLPRDDREELYRAVLDLSDRVAELEARIVRLEAREYVDRIDEDAGR